MGTLVDSAGGGRGGLGGMEGGAAGGERSTEKGVGRARAERGLECFVCQPRLVNSPSCCIPGLRISVCRSSEGHGGNLTLDIQFESATKFDHQSPEVRVSGIRG